MIVNGVSMCCRVVRTGVQVHITELPIGKWTQEYKQFLDGQRVEAIKEKEKEKAKAAKKAKKKTGDDGADGAAEDADGDKKGDKEPNAGLIQSLTEENTDTKVSFRIKLAPGAIEKVNTEAKLMKVFRLESPLSTTNMHLFDKEGRIHKYSSAEEIISDFYELRLEYYGLRKAHLLEQLTEAWSKLDNKMRFISMVINDELRVSKKKKKDLMAELKKLGFVAFAPPANKKGSKAQAADDAAAAADADEGDDDDAVRGYNYLLSMPLWSLTQERVDKLRKERDGKADELDALRALSPAALWLRDLDQLESVLRGDFDKECGNMAPVGNAALVFAAPEAPVKRRGATSAAAGSVVTLGAVDGDEDAMAGAGAAGGAPAKKPRAPKKAKDAAGAAKEPKAVKAKKAPAKKRADSEDEGVWDSDSSSAPSDISDDDADDGAAAQPVVRRTQRAAALAAKPVKFDTTLTDSDMSGLDDDDDASDASDDAGSDGEEASVFVPTPKKKPSAAAPPKKPTAAKAAKKADADDDFDFGREAKAAPAPKKAVAKVTAAPSLAVAAAPAPAPVVAKPARAAAAKKKPVVDDSGSDGFSDSESDDFGMTDSDDEFDSPAPKKKAPAPKKTNAPAKPAAAVAVAAAPVKKSLEALAAPAPVAAAPKPVRAAATKKPIVVDVSSDDFSGSDDDSDASPPPKSKPVKKAGPAAGKPSLASLSAVDTAAKPSKPVRAAAPKKAIVDVSDSDGEAEFTVASTKPAPAKKAAPAKPKKRSKGSDSESDADASFSGNDDDDDDDYEGMTLMQRLLKKQKK